LFHYSFHYQPVYYSSLLACHGEEGAICAYYRRKDAILATGYNYSFNAVYRSLAPREDKQETLLPLADRLMIGERSKAGKNC
jgi:hypothetical protein